MLSPKALLLFPNYAKNESQKRMNAVKCNLLTQPDIAKKMQGRMQETEAKNICLITHRRQFVRRRKLHDLFSFVVE